MTSRTPRPRLKLTESSNSIPESIQGYVSVRGERSPFDVENAKALRSSKPYRASRLARAEARHAIERCGLAIVEESPLGFAVSGPAGAYEELTGARIAACEHMTSTVEEAERPVTRLDLVGRGQPAALGLGRARSKSAGIDGVVLDKPRHVQGSPSPTPPRGAGKYHLTLPKDLAAALNATPLHQAGIRGDGVLVASPDTGHYPHPFFAKQGYHAAPAISVIPGANPAQDPIGHGTGISANLFAVAPGVSFQPIRATTNLGIPIGFVNGFMKAKGLKPAPRIITCSWVSPTRYPPAQGVDAPDTVMVTEIRHAIETGIIVVFGSGNGQFGAEPQVPGVISAGGVYRAKTGALCASDVASGYASPWFGGVAVPTVCGLIGMKPRGQYIMMPVQPGCIFDITESLPTTAEFGDGTFPDDGWAVFSGTSVAAPQVAGVIALLLGQKPNLTLTQVREALTATAIDVVSGTCSAPFSNPATPGPDLATGAGLVNAKAASDYVKARF